MDSLIWETASTRTHKPKIVNESLQSQNRPKIGFQDQLSLYAGQKYCIMLQGTHSAIHLTFIKLLFVIKTFVLSILEWPFYKGFTVVSNFLGYMKGFTSLMKGLTSNPQGNACETIVCIINELS